MLDELQTAVKDYQTKWQAFTAARPWLARLQPTSAGWKTTDLADFDRRFAELRGQCDQIHLGWVNERWLATLHLKSATLPWGITVIKLMQRRPGSADRVGLDNVDFYAPGIGAEQLAADPTLVWRDERNGPHARWFSLRFAGGAEAKLRRDTVLDVCVAEMRDVRQSIAGPTEAGR